MEYEKFLKVNDDGTVTLFHGSRGGIEGNITPSSRQRCDFGRGFYMGTLPMQAKSLVSNDDSPFFYQLKFDISGIDKSKILVLSDEDWLFAVLANRKNSLEFSNLEIAKTIIAREKEYDVIIGEIADDKMRYAMSSFTENALTDKGLMYCLCSTNAALGYQIVATTQQACDLITIEKETPLKGLELADAIKYGADLSKSCEKIVSEAKMQFDEEGFRLTQLIKKERFGNSILSDNSVFRQKVSAAVTKSEARDMFTEAKARKAKNEQQLKL